MPTALFNSAGDNSPSLNDESAEPVPKEAEEEKSQGLHALGAESRESEAQKMEGDCEQDGGEGNVEHHVGGGETVTGTTGQFEEDDRMAMVSKCTATDGSPEQRLPAGCSETENGTEKEIKPEQSEENQLLVNDCIKSQPSDDGTEKITNGSGDHRRWRPSLEMSSSDGEPLSRMDSEDSICSTLLDMESTASSGRSTPSMTNGPGSTTSSTIKNMGYICCWDQCLACFSSSPDLAQHIQGIHVDGQRGGVFVCLWKGCKVYKTPSTSQSWLQRHMLTHSGDKPFKCVVGGCNASFASQGGLARHVPSHFSQQNSSRASSMSRLKEESPSKAGLNKRRKLKNKRRRTLPRPHDFFDAETMDAIRHRAICLNLATHIESLGNGHSVVFNSTVMARRKEDSGKVKVLLHWTPEDILPDVWVNETDRSQLKTKVVHLSQLPQDTATLLDPNIYRTLPAKRLKQRMFL